MEELMEQLGLLQPEIINRGFGSSQDIVILEDQGKKYFIKSSLRAEAKAEFKCEFYSLKKLRKVGKVKTPTLIQQGSTTSGIHFICLKYIDSYPLSDASFELLGQRLAKLHEQTNSSFGWPHDNFISILPQSNTANSNWTEFYLTNRLVPQIERAIQQGYLGSISSEQLNLFYKELEDHIVTEQPSLIHGDLWNGNVLGDQKGEVFFIDPAAFYGNREMDIAMSLLFGGFNNSFYSAYMESNPLKEGWKDRIEIYQLYYLLVHLNLFGQAYEHSVTKIIKSYL